MGSDGYWIEYNSSYIKFADKPFQGKKSAKNILIVLNNFRDVMLRTYHPGDVRCMFDLGQGVRT